MNNINLDSLDLNGLKSLAYDLIALGQNTQKNLDIVNQEIAKRNQLEVITPEVETPKEVDTTTGATE